MCTFYRVFFSTMKQTMRKAVLLITLLCIYSCTGNYTINHIERKPSISYRDSIISIIKESEGFSSRSYKCPAGHLTKGYGKVTSDTSYITEQEATIFIQEDISYRIQYVQQLYHNCDSLQLYTMAWVLYAYKPSSYRNKLLDSICDNNILYLQEFIYYTDSTGNLIKSKRLNNTVNKILTLWGYTQ